MVYDSREITQAERIVLSISELNREVRALLEGSFPLVWVEGEISNLARPASGHIYFSLKDEAAQVRCAMFRNRNMHLGFRPENGTQVLARARVSLYEGRGEFQLIIEHMEEAGDGALRRAFEALKQRLSQEGLFDAEHKRPLPALPRRIGVITSPSGAAIHDILTVLRRRFPGIEVIVYPVPVQGDEAAPAIAKAIAVANRRQECDVLIVGRGGGSLEDLWAFNEELVARAIHESKLPVISAVGHEIDFTIADFVADHRAPTPSAAAELISPDREQWLTQLERLQQRLQRGQATALQQLELRLEGLGKRLKHPGRRLEEMAQRLDEREQRLYRGMEQALHRRENTLATLQARLHRHTPVHRLEALQTREQHLGQRLTRAMARRLEQHRHRLHNSVHALNTVSPLATLSRGYAIASHHPGGGIIRDSAEVQSGEAIEARLGKGRLRCRVEEIIHEEN